MMSNVDTIFFVYQWPAPYYVTIYYLGTLAFYWKKTPVQKYIYM